MINDNAFKLFLGHCEKLELKTPNRQQTNILLLDLKLSLQREYHKNELFRTKKDYQNQSIFLKVKPSDMHKIE